jgi:hypothetical protein
MSKYIQKYALEMQDKLAAEVGATLKKFTKSKRGRPAYSAKLLQLVRDLDCAVKMVPLAPLPPRAKRKLEAQPSSIAPTMMFRSAENVP